MPHFAPCAAQPPAANSGVNFGLFTRGKGVQLDVVLEDISRSAFIQDYTENIPARRAICAVETIEAPWQVPSPFNDETAVGHNPAVAAKTAKLALPSGLHIRPRDIGCVHEAVKVNV